jgi:hypothetical protein
MYDPQFEFAASGPVHGRDVGADIFHKSDEKPFQPALELQDATLLEGLGIPLPDDPGVLGALNCWIANLVGCAQRDIAGIFYSRDDAHYSRTFRYAPQFYRRRFMVQAVDWLVAAGLATHRRTRPSRSAWYRSRVQPTPSFRAELEALPVGTTRYKPREVIILRADDGLPLPYRETSKIGGMRRDILEHNAFLSRFAISVSHPEAHINAHGFLVVGGRRIDPTRKAYHRVFNGNFGRGGRWYGPFWQGLPARVRAGLVIDGQPTVERDIRGCHMRLLCACAGINLGNCDPYALPHLARGEVKAAVNIMLNAPDWPSARGALVEGLSAGYGRFAGRHAYDLRAAIEARFPALAPFWNSGYGLTLQNVDADICRRVQRRLRDDSVPCLSIHDSFVVPQPALERTTGLMEEEFDRACGRIAGRRAN